MSLSVLKTGSGSPSQLQDVPISQYVTALARLDGSDPLSEEWRLAERGWSEDRKYDQIDSAWRYRNLRFLSKMLTAAQLNEVNGGMALFAGCGQLIYTNERNFIEFGEDVNLIEWEEQSPTGIPPGISWYSYTNSGNMTRYALSDQIPNAALLDPEFGDERLRRMMSAVSRTASYTLQRQFALSLANRGWRVVLNKYMRSRHAITYEMFHEFQTEHLFAGVFNKERIASIFNKAVEAYPRKDVIVVPSDALWTIYDWTKDASVVFQARVSDQMPAGETTMLGEALKGLTYAAAGSYEGRRILKCPRFVQVAIAQEGAGYQPMQKRIVLSTETEFRNPLDTVHAVVADHVLQPDAAAILTIHNEDAKWNRVTLHEAMGSNGCGLIFGDDDKSPSKQVNAYIDKLKAMNEADKATWEKVAATADACENPHSDVMTHIRTARNYDDMRFWRADPVGVCKMGNQIGFAERIADVQNQHIPTSYVGALARAIARLKMTPSELARIFGFAWSFTSYALDNMSSLHIDVSTGRDDVRQLLFDIFARLNRNSAGVALQPSAQKIKIDSLLREGTSTALSQATTIMTTFLSSLPGNDSAHAKEFAGILNERLGSASANPKHQAAHLQVALSVIDSTQMDTGGITGDHVKTLRQRMPTVAELQQGSLAAATAPLGASLVGADLPRVAITSRSLDRVTGYHRSEREIKAEVSTLSGIELAIFVSIFQLPFDLHTLKRWASLGLPLVTGTVTRFSQTLDAYSVIALNSEDSVLHLLTPLTATLSSAGVRRITRFTFEYMGGDVWRLGNGVMEMMGVFPCRFVGGMGLRFMKNFGQVQQALMARKTDFSGPDCLFLHRPVTEQTIDRPSSIFGEIFSRPEIQGREGENHFRKKTTGGTWLRQCLTEGTLKMIVKAQNDALQQSSGGSVIGICSVQHRAYTFHQSPGSSRFDLAKEGTGPWGMQATNDHRYIGHVLNGEKGMLLRHEAFLPGI